MVMMDMVQKTHFSSISAAKVLLLLSIFQIFRLKNAILLFFPCFFLAE
jgi:hypothetical protein